MSSAETETSGGASCPAAQLPADEALRATTPPHPNPGVMDRLLAKRHVFSLTTRNMEVPENHLPYRSSPLAEEQPQPRKSFSHKRSETLPSLSAMTAAPPGLGSVPVPSAKPRFRPAHGKSASLSGSGIAQMFGGQGATAAAAAESRPSHLRHVRNRSGGSFGSTSDMAKMTGWRNGQNEGRELLPLSVAPGDDEEPKGNS